MVLDGDASCADVPEASLAVSLQAPGEQFPNALRDAGGQLFPARVLREHRGEYVAVGLPDKSPFARQHLEQNRAKGPYVGALICRFPPRLLRTHVRSGAQNYACLRTIL